MNHIFVSHATADHAIVDKICDELERRAIALWVDHRKGIPVGENWTSAIQDAVHTCEAGLLVLSKASAASDWCDKECTRILGLKKKLYIVLIEPLALEEIPIQYANLQYLDLSTSFDQLPELVEAMVGKKALDERDPAVKKIKRLTGRIDRSLTAIPLQGRGDDLAKCLHSLSEAPVFIVGVGGKGKSRLAAEVALTAEAYDGIVWHYVQSFYTADDLLAALRDHLGLDALADTNAILKQLRGDKTLIVVDNAESVSQDARAGYIDLLENAFSAGAGVLITSRERWGSLDPAVEVSPGELSSANAEALVLEMAHAYGVTTDLSPHAGAIAADARKHPRLIETAVKQAKQLPVAQVLSNLREFRGRDFETTLDNMIRASFKAMTDNAGDAPLNALCRLSVTRGGFRYAAALALCAPDLPDENALQAALVTLADWQFCRLGAGERYRLDPLAAEVAGRELTTATLTPDPYRAHYDYYKDIARAADNAIRATKYLELDPESDNLDAAFEWAMAADPEAAYWLANACQDFLANRARFAKRMEWFTRLEIALSGRPVDYTVAALQNSLGNVYQEHPLGNRRDHLRRAIAAYRAALLHYTADAAPMDYAMTQNNLGTAYGDLAALEDKADNLRRAIALYEAALVYRTADAAPMDYAMTQNNLGNAYSDLAAVENKAGNLQRAIASFEVALEHYTVDAAPTDYAMTQNNLGSAYSDLSELEDKADNLRRAIAAYQAALVYRTADAAPLNYAMTQNNLGTAYINRAALEDKAGNLRRAIAAYGAALVYRTASAAPMQYAMTQSNLGIDHEDNGDLRAAIACWREAEKGYRQMDMLERADLMLTWIADGEARLGGEQ